MDETVTTPTRVDILLKFFKNNKFTSVLIVLCVLLISLGKLSESLRTLGIYDSYDTNSATERGKFSSDLVRDAWNRLFWIRVYTERVKLKASPEEQQQAWQKYMDSSEKWSSNIMNYYLGLDEYYPKSDKREQLENIIQPKFIIAGKLMAQLKYGLDTLQVSDAIIRADAIQSYVNSINPDLYHLIDQRFQKINQ